MPRIAYTTKNFSASSLETIELADQICREYGTEGFDLTLRQLYYQFVSRGLIANSDREYKRLGSIINDARLAGELDWTYINDRTRNLRGGDGGFRDPAHMIRSAAQGYYIPRWDEQDYHVEVWIEKDALVGVLEQACPDLRVGYFSCRGYTSQSEMWSAAQRLRRAIGRDKMVRVIHLGDHDPSGIDMTRDITERLSMFIAQDLELGGPDAEPWEYVEALKVGAYGFDELEFDPFNVERIALNMDQIRRYNPPPNPAKLSDSRGAGYVQRFGNSSWELDALEPRLLVQLIRDKVYEYIDEPVWEEREEREERERKILTVTDKHWPEVARFVETSFADELADDDE